MEQVQREQLVAVHVAIMLERERVRVTRAQFNWLVNIYDTYR